MGRCMGCHATQCGGSAVKEVNFNAVAVCYAMQGAVWGAVRNAVGDIVLSND